MILKCPRKLLGECLGSCTVEELQTIEQQLERSVSCIRARKVFVINTSDIVLPETLYSSWPNMLILCLESESGFQRADWATKREGIICLFISTLRNKEMKILCLRIWYIITDPMKSIPYMIPNFLPQEGIFASFLLFFTVLNCWFCVPCLFQEKVLLAENARLSEKVNCHYCSYHWLFCYENILNRSISWTLCW